MIRYEHSLYNRTHLDDKDLCYIFYEKLSEGYSASDANQIVFNFKIPPNKKGTKQWYFKEKAIREFASLICDIFSNIDDNLIIIPAPTSKPRAHPDFDDRLDAVAQLVQECKPNIHAEYALDTIKETTKAHLGGSRNPAEIYANTKWNGIKNLNSNAVILIDDVLTTGGHFKAYKQMILDNEPGIDFVIGVFLAIQVRK